MAIVEIDFSTLGATMDTRVDIVLRIPARQPAPAAYVPNWDAGLVLLDLADVESPANGSASLPMERVYFNYHHFHN
jgi:hypothetical protein